MSDGFCWFDFVEGGEEISKNGEAKNRDQEDRQRDGETGDFLKEEKRVIQEG